MAEEPWLSGSLSGLDPVLAALLYSFEQIRTELAAWTAGLSTEQMWTRPQGLAPVGFQLRHIAGSADRLFTYARGEALSDMQMSALKSEMEPGATRDELLAALDAVFDRVSAQVRTIDPATLREPRAVGRLHLPTTLAGLLIHIAEHSQRHLGQAIVTAKLLRANP